MDVNLSRPQEIVKAWHAAVHRVTKSDTTERLNKGNNLFEGMGGKDQFQLSVCKWPSFPYVSLHPLLCVSMCLNFPFV